MKQKVGESVMGRYYFVSPVDKDVKTTSTVTTTSDLPESAGKGSAVTPVFPIVPIDLSSKTLPGRYLLEITFDLCVIFQFSNVAVA